MAHLEFSSAQKAILASFPMILCSFLAVFFHSFFAPHNLIFFSPYFLAILTTSIILSIVLLKGQICRGQQKRLLFVASFLMIYPLVHIVFSFMFTPKHNPLVVANLALILSTFTLGGVFNDRHLMKSSSILSCIAALAAAVLYTATYYFELPSLFNYLRANNFAQIVLGLVISLYMLTLAKTRLDNLCKWLIKLAMIALVINYIWVVFVLFLMKDLPLNLIIIALYGIMQFILLILLAWMLIKDDAKNMLIHTACVILSSLFPIISLV